MANTYTAKKYTPMGFKLGKVPGTRAECPEPEAEELAAAGKNILYSIAVKNFYASISLFPYTGNWSVLISVENDDGQHEWWCLRRNYIMFLTADRIYKTVVGQVLNIEKEFIFIAEVDEIFKEATKR